MKFQEWTADNHMRQPIFLGLREDKPAKKVKRETPVPSPPEEQSQATLTHLDKVYWPEDGYTKGDLVEYYRDMSPVILPYLRDRPMSMLRHPNGINGASFFQKDVSKQPPPKWVETVLVPSEEGKKTIQYALCQNEQSLLYMANLGCIELNTWTAKKPQLDRPTFLVIDLDPEDIPFRRVVETALAVRKVMEDAGAACWCKTSGKRGLHISIPLGGKYDHDHSRQFAELVAMLVNQKLPATTSLERSPSKRQKRVYLDYLQNRSGQTLAAPYSVRPIARACVSTPLAWKEVNAKLDPSKFTIRTLAKRLDKVGDLWAGVAGVGVDLQECVERLTRHAKKR